ncbi:LysR family transcriptional regulator [Paracoccus tegillarcae]|uniref:LysR family transcriptional regulator n=1 Tax=Paracoccus tegillarcae TaxID=1529068 RepID=A0A2K9F1W4_9RHOB|nr:LysR family transcriptional regulator [Paracoccus tegillarcae]AUH35554.1 LysR family transcriptional regulator [Paracoccus tegillarcae]
MRMDHIDWNHARAFLATADTGSLSGAARRLGLTQPTLSRQVAGFEADLGVTLFERIGKRLVLTETGRSLLDHVRAMGDAAQAMRTEAIDQASQIDGRVCISTIDAYAVHILPDIIARIRREAPQITLMILSADTLSDLRRREADIAIRHVRPEQDGLIGQLLGESTAHFYASAGWKARNPHVQKIGDLGPGDLIGFDDLDRFAAMMDSIGAPIAPDTVRLLSSDAITVAEMARRELGVCLMIDEVAARMPELLPLFPGFSAPRFPVWLVTHRELRTSRRIRLVYDILADELSRVIGRPAKGFS